MKAQQPEETAVPGIAPTIYALVHDEAVRWRQAASANHWTVLDLPAGVASGRREETIWPSPYAASGQYAAFGAPTGGGKTTTAEDG